jgi:predicted nucleic acid-binding protein
MQAVIDTSYLINSIRNIKSEKFQWIRVGRLYAPYLLKYEYNNVICGQKQSKEAEYAERELIRLLEIKYMDIFNEKLVSFLFDKYNLTFYDASYLSLAIELGLPLATHDNKLIKVAPQEGVSLIQ